MLNSRRDTACFLFMMGFLLLRGISAFAQVDFSGEWAPLYHEDGQTSPRSG